MADERLEPKASGYGDAVQVSIAISLKRIADFVTTPPALIAGDKLSPEAAEEVRKHMQGDARTILVSQTPPDVRWGTKTFELIGERSPPDPQVKLGAMSPGLFLIHGELCVKTEYSTSIAGGGSKPDCYIVASGERFCGGLGVSERDLRGLLVTPVKVHLP